MKIAVCIPSTARAYTTIYWAVAFKKLRFPDQHEVFVSQEPDLATARNQLVANALKWGADKLFFLDDDVIPCVYDKAKDDLRFDPDAPKLLLEHDADAVTALYSLQTGEFACYKLSHDIRPYDKGEVELGKVHSVEGFGFGCCVIDSAVFKKMPSPWFKWLTDSDFRIRRGEDVYFTRRLKDLGFKAVVDARVVCRHVLQYFLKHDRRIEYPAVPAVRG